MTDEIELYAEITRKNTRIQQLNAHLIVMAAAARTLLSVIDQDDPGDEWGRAVDNMRSVTTRFLYRRCCWRRDEALLDRLGIE